MARNSQNNRGKHIKHGLAVGAAGLLAYSCTAIMDLLDEAIIKDQRQATDFLLQGKSHREGSGRVYISNDNQVSWYDKNDNGRCDPDESFAISSPSMGNLPIPCDADEFRSAGALKVTQYLGLNEMDPARVRLDNIIAKIHKMDHSEEKRSYYRVESPIGWMSVSFTTPELVCSEFYVSHKWLRGNDTFCNEMPPSLTKYANEIVDHPSAKLAFGPMHPIRMMGEIVGAELDHYGLEGRKPPKTN